MLITSENMPGKKILFFSAIFLITNSLKNTASAQVSYDSEGLRESIYLSVGTGNATYGPSTISIQQSNASSYDLGNVNADNKAAPSGGGFSTHIRAGFFFDHEQKMAVELNIDPVTYHVTDDQNVNLKGTIEHHSIDTNFAFSSKNGYSYYLNSSNLILVNFVYRMKLVKTQSNNFRIDLLAKAGFGPVMPHVINTLGGKTAESPAFQLAGWDAGIEAALRFTIMRHVFLEVAPKYTYASYTDVNVYNGTATQKLKATQVVFSLGYWFSITKHNPLFEKGVKERKAITIKPIHPQPLDEVN